jgi:hypothetical protein
VLLMLDVARQSPGWKIVKTMRGREIVLPSAISNDLGPRCETGHVLRIGESLAR